MIPKYRAWISEADTMTNDLKGIDFENETVVLKKFYWEDGFPVEEEVFEVEIGNAIPMQSTGLKDYFGEELFEGDVIEWSYWDEFEDSGTAKIIFDKGMFKLLDVRTEKSVWDNLFDCIENCNVFLQGNIYENRELLEEKE
jgi:uncharacterized phage protein (TIGR01671 family)